MPPVRVLTAVLLLALPATAFAETFEVGPSVGTKYTTRTVLQKGKSYKITVTGTIDVTFDINQPKPPYHETYDALYCTKTDWPERKAYCDPQHPDASISATQGFNYPITLNTERDRNDSNQFVPYESSHSYTRKVTAAKTGAAVFETRPFGTVPDTQKWTGAYTVTILEPGAKLCQGLPATIVGEEEPGEVNRIVGTPGPDIIVGTNSDDLILGGGGEDVLCGFGGEDTMNGGGGADVMHGGAGRDRVIGGVDDFGDTLSGGSGDDKLSGGQGGDTLFGNAGDDILDGGSGNSEDDRDSLNGGPGDDELISRHSLTDVNYGQSTAPITLDLEAGTARGWGKDKLSGTFRAIGSKFGDTLRGTEREDTILGGAGNDIIDGRGGDDFLFGDEGNDEITGGTGSDRCLDGERLKTCEVSATG
jgi:Ca2+-binding RTX toxin-like protein